MRPGQGADRKPQPRPLGRGPGEDRQGACPRPLTLSESKYPLASALARHAGRSRCRPARALLLFSLLREGSLPLRLRPRLRSCATRARPPSGARPFFAVRLYRVAKATSGRYFRRAKKKRRGLGATPTRSRHPQSYAEPPKRKAPFTQSLDCFGGFLCLLIPFCMVSIRFSAAAWPTRAAKPLGLSI